MNYCRKTGKVQHANQREARSAMAHATARHNDHTFRHVYKCRFCGWFHFGTPDKKIPYHFIPRRHE